MSIFEKSLFLASALLCKEGMKKIYLGILLLLLLCVGAYSTYAQANLESRQLGLMCETIRVYEEECGTAAPSECKSENKAAIDGFLSLCFFNNTSNSLACLKRINWLYADMFANHKVEPCKTSLQ